jgi:hypothetical protein
MTMDSEKAPGGGFLLKVTKKESDAIYSIINHQADGAIPCGRRVVKVRAEAEDRTANGTQGTVLGSAAPGKEPMYINGLIINYGYMILWDGDTIPVLCVDVKIEEL